jgi:phosphoribosyl-ATP pyrophosphohydrolase
MIALFRVLLYNYCIMTLHKLEKLIEAKKLLSPEVSYTAKMTQKGVKKIAQKVGEEAVEVVIAALAEGKQELISESADLIYHHLLLLSISGVKLDEVLGELEKRMIEKANE